MSKVFAILVLALLTFLRSKAETVWEDDFETYAAGTPLTNSGAWVTSGETGVAVLVSTNASFRWRSSAQLTPPMNSAQLCSAATARAGVWRSCSNNAPVLQRVSWSCFATNAAVEAMALEVRDSFGNTFCSVSMGAGGRFYCKARNGEWADTGVSYAPNVWHRLILRLNYSDRTFSFFEKTNPIAMNWAFATNQTASFIPADIHIQGPANIAGGCYVDAIKAEFLEDGSDLQAMIDSSAAGGRVDLAAGRTYDVNYPLVLPDNFVFNGNGSTLRMAPYTQLPLLANANWSGNQSITISNLTLDGNAWDQAINPANNAVRRYLAASRERVDNQGGYFKKVSDILISNVTFQDIPNEALMLVSNRSARIVDCLFTNCALLTISNNMSQAAVYTRWTTHSTFINNRFYGCFEGGIANGTGSDYNLLAGNFTTNCAGGEGVFLGQSSYCVSAGNTILDSAWLGDPLNFPSTHPKYWGYGAGIACDGIGQAGSQVSNIICRNYIWRTGSAGITSASAIGTKIWGNRVYEANCLNKANPSGAIGLFASTNSTVYNNIAQSNNCVAIGVLQSKNCSATNNLIAPANALNAVFSTNSININADFNYRESASNSEPFPGSATIKDDADDSGVAISGAWTPSFSIPGFCGDGYLHDNNTGKAGGKSVEFRPTLAAGGIYAVFMNWSAAENRAGNVPVDVIHPGETNTCFVNQQVRGGEWNWLRNCHFAAGNSSSVIVRNDGANGYVIADAVLFALVMPEPVLTLSVNIAAPGYSLTLAWTEEAIGCRVQSAAHLAPPLIWTTLMTIGSGPSAITLPASDRMMFYRLTPPLAAYGN